MNWKKIFAFCLIAGVVLSVAGCGNKSSTSKDSDGEYDQTETEEYGDETAYNSLGYAPTDEILNATLDDVKIQIGNTVYGPGSTIEDLFNGRWDVMHSDNYGFDAKSVDPTSLIFPDESFDLIVYPAEDHSFEIDLLVENTSEESVSLDECTIAEDIDIQVGDIDTDYYREDHDVCVWFPGGVNYKSSKDEVEDIYGEPEKPGNALTYRVDSDSQKYIEYSFSFPYEEPERYLFVTKGSIQYKEL